jgi:hypothetical protein
VRRPQARAALFGCAGQLDTVELELGCGARHRQLAEPGEHFADAAWVVAEIGPLSSERIEARVVVLERRRPRIAGAVRARRT